MSHRKKLIKLAESKGFELVRKSKHFIYKKGDVTVVIPNHNKTNTFTYKGIIKQIEAV